MQQNDVDDDNDDDVDDDDMIIAKNSSPLNIQPFKNLLNECGGHLRKDNFLYEIFICFEFFFFLDTGILISELISFFLFL